MNTNIPVTVNSDLAEAYVDGCNSWYNNTEKTIEIGDGGTSSCPNDLNYALSSDIIYHEYTHAITESIGHWPYVDGSESAAISEGLSDYFATTMNNDSLFGEVTSPSRTRNLNNNVNYQTDMLGEVHYDSLAFSGALWDLRTEIGTTKTDALVFNTLYQNRTHFETFMYGMIIEDDDDEDFSNGTPHLIAIIQAFENHGIGPGVENFNGLPIDPEAWSQLLEDAEIEGEEEDLYLAHNGDCTVSGTTSLTVPSGGTCYVTSTETYSGNITVYGTLVVGNTSSSHTTLTAQGNMYVNGGTVINGYSSAASVNSRIDVDGTLYVYNSGLLYNRYAETNTAHNYITPTNLYVGTSSSSGTVRTDDPNPYSTSGTTYVYSNLQIRAGSKLDTSGSTYIHNSGALLTVYSGATYETNFLYMGESDGSPVGGTLSNSGTTTINYDTYAYTDAGITSSGTLTGRLIKLAGISDTSKTTMTNSGTMTLDRLQMWDNSSFSNTGTTTLKGSNVTNYSALVMEEATASTTYNPVLTNGTSGTSTSGIIYVGDDILLYDNAEIINYYLIRQDYSYNSTTETDSNLLKMEDDSLFNNNDSSSYYYNYNSDSTRYGEVKILEDAEFRTQGRILVYRLKVGEKSSTTEGGEVNVNTAGRLDVNDTSSSSAEIYGGGKIYISSAAYSTYGLNINGTLTIEGRDANLVYAKLENNDDNATILKVVMNIYSRLENGTSSTSAKLYLEDATTSFTNTNGSSQVYNYGGDLYFNSNSTVTTSTTSLLLGMPLTNSSGATVHFPGKLIIGSTNTLDTRINNAGTVDIDGYMQMDDGSQYSGAGDLDVGYGVTMTDDSDFDQSGGAVSFGTTSSTSNLLMSDDSTFDITGGTTSIAHDVSLTEDSHFANGDATGTNYGTVTVGNNFTIDRCGNSSSTTRRASAFNRGGSMKIINSLQIDDDGLFENSHSATLNVKEDIHLYNVSTAIETGGYDESDGQFDNLTSSTTNIADDLIIEETAEVNNNNATISVAVADGTSSLNNELKMVDTSRFNNSSSALIEVDHKSDGVINLQESAQFNNYSGTTSTKNLYIGDATPTNGGYFNNDAIFNIAGNAYVANTGAISNDGSSADINITGSLHIDVSGASLSDSQVTTSAPLDAASIYIDKNGLLQIDDDTVTATNIYIYGDMGGSNPGYLNLTTGDSPILNTTNLYIGTSNDPGRMNNYGTVTASGVVNIQGYVGGATELFNAVGGTFNSTGSGDVTLAINAKVVNYGTMDIDYDLNITSSGARFEQTVNDSDLNVDGTLYIDNAGYFLNGLDSSTINPDVVANEVKIGTSIGGGTIENAGYFEYTNKLQINGDDAYGTGDEGVFLNHDTGYLYSPTASSFLLVEPYGYLINETNTNSAVSGVNVQNVYLNNSQQTAYSSIRNTGHFFADTISIKENGEFRNDGDISGTINVTAMGTDPTVPNCAYNNGNLVSVDANKLYVYENGDFMNYDDLCLDELHVGIISTSTLGGDLYGTQDSRIHVDNNTSTAAEMYEGRIRIDDQNTTTSYFRVGDIAETGGKITIKGATTGDLQLGALQNSIDTTPIGEDSYVYFYDMDIEEKGEYLGSGYTVIRNDLNIDGDNLTTCDVTASTGCGTAYNTTAGDLYVEGDTNVNNDGLLHNLGTFDATGPVTVTTEGVISSEIYSATTFDSYFKLHDTTTALSTQGTVTMANNVAAYGDVNVTDGTTTFGIYNRAGTANLAKDLNVTGGTFESYSNLTIIDDVLVNDSGAKDAHAKFSGTITNGPECHTEVNGNFSVINAGKATISCEYTNSGSGWDYAMYVDQASTNGFTYIGGGTSVGDTSTLYLDTSLKTREMYIGYDGTNSEKGVVTHNVTNSGFPNEADTSKLRVDELLDIKATTGSIDVSGKSSHNVNGANPHGGSYGGKGQVDSGATANVENGYKEPSDGPALHLGEKGCLISAEGGCDSESRAGGIINVWVGDTSDIYDGSGTLIINGDILANGFDCGSSGADCNSATSGYGEGAGSGGSISLIANGLIKGSGTIQANGGNDTEDTNADSAGGGGRITIMSGNNLKPEEDGTFSGSASLTFTGTVEAIGGEGTNSDYTNTRYAGTGTASYAFLDKTINQIHGWTVIDEKDRRDTTHIIDTNGSGTEDFNDYTKLQKGFTVESLRAINGGILDLQDSNNHHFQQCVEDPDSDIKTKSGFPYYWNFYQTNGSLTYTNTVATLIADDYCKYTADPPPSEANSTGNGVYINNSGTGAQTADHSTNSSSPVHIADVSPAISAVYLDGRIGGTSVSKATDAHVQIATTQALLDANNPDICDTSIATVGHLSLSSWISDGARSENLLLPYATGCQLSTNTTYHWRVHFKYDEDGASGTTGDNVGWGLWSETQYVTLDESGEITVGTCPSAAGSYDIVLDNFDLATATPDNTDEENCTILIDSTIQIGVNAQKDHAGLEHTADTSQVITDMELADDNSTAGGFGDALDGKAADGTTDMNEIGFYTSSATSDLNYGTATNGNNKPYNTYFHFLPNANKTKAIVYTSAGTPAANNQSFKFNIGAYIHAILNNNVTWAETYDGQVTLTLTTYP